MPEHMHEWRYWEQGEFDMWEDGWECVECDARFPTEEIARRLNATDRLGADMAKSAVEAKGFVGGLITALSAYAAALEED